MHRSGTSALTRVLSLRGASLPTNLMEPLPLNNERGFWESKDIAELNDEILVSGHSAWDDLFEFSPSWYDSKVAEHFAVRALEVLQRDFSRSRLFALKDPRMCRLVPFWADVLRRFDTEPCFVHIIRNPLEIAASLKARDGILPAHSQMIWLRHVLDAEKDTRGRRRCFVHYEDLLNDWRGVTDKIARALEFRWPRESHHTAVAIEDFLSHGLRHHNFADRDLEKRADVPEWTKQVYESLSSLVRGRPKGALGSLDRVRREWEVADRAYGPLVAGNLQRVWSIGASSVERRVTVAGGPDEEHSRGWMQMLEELPSVKEEIAGIRGQLVRLEAIEAGLGRLADLQARVAQLQAIEPRLDRVEQELGRLARIEERLAPLAELERGMARLEAMEARMEKLERLEGKIDRLLGMETELARLKRLEKEMARLEKVETTLAELRQLAGMMVSLEERLVAKDLEIERLRRDLEAREARFRGQEVEVTRMFRELADAAAVDSD
ncbi:MAG TPA: sulfotransferase [Vicinamibacteria bacterium]|nr:sulfotransferase [Vicinamibacteria bacterium]